MNARYDIVIMSDFRFTGGAASGIVEEIKAQSRAGYSTALIHLPAAVIQKDREFHPDLLELIKSRTADLLPSGRLVRGRLLQIRHPSVLQRLPVMRPNVDADVKILVANSCPFNRDRSRMDYNINSVQTTIEVLWGDTVLWAPLGPLVRETLLQSGWKLNITPEDWYEIINPDDWKCDRSRFAADRPVIGRHSRPGAEKWPDTVEGTLAAYPDDARFIVRILGGESAPLSVLGRKPANWDVHEFGSMPAKTFLCEIDFFVYFHHPTLIEAFGRTMLEAISSGAVAILPRHFEVLFKDAAVYATPDQVRDIVLRLYGDRAAYQAQAERGYQYACRHFSYETHVKRVEKLIGPPAGRGAGPSALLDAAHTDC
jgi:hypothetical protein